MDPTTVASPCQECRGSTPLENKQCKIHKRHILATAHRNLVDQCVNSIPRLGKTIFTITSRNFQGHSIAAPVWHNSAVGECWELDLGVGCHLLGFLILFGGCLALGFSLGLRGDYYLLLFLPGLGFGSKQVGSCCHPGKGHASQDLLGKPGKEG